MDGLMMDFPLTLTHLLRRAEQFFPEREIVTRMPDKSFHRTTYGETMRRSKQLAAALKKAGLQRGDRVATLCWNHHQHHEAYFGIPCGGFVLHTLNLRLHPGDLAYIATHANDKAVIVDRQLLPLLESFKAETPIEHVFVVEDSYEELLATADPDEWVDPQIDENEAAATCFTSGTTGRPRGVVYSHRSSVLHALGVAANNPLGMGIGVDDVILPVVPMFHANAWGYPYLATMQGAKLVYPGPHLDPDSLLEDMEAERVTWAAGVPTIWMGILARLDAEPGRWDLSAMKAMLVGGSAVPGALIAAFESRHGLKIIQGWGMTETSPVASTACLPPDLMAADEETRWDFQAMAGMPAMAWKSQRVSSSAAIRSGGRQAVDATGDVSVMPQPWMIFKPCRDSNAAISAPGTAEPPTSIAFIAERSQRPGSASSRARIPIQIVGTPAAHVTRSASMSSSSESGSRWGPG